nr:hypothetical protein [Tanacetum cinerariifolium]
MFQQHQGESLSEARTCFKDLLQKNPHHDIDLWLKVQIFYDHVNSASRRTIDQSAGGSKVTTFDLLGLIEDEVLFGNPGDEDAVCVCLLLALEVIFMGRLLVQEVNDTLMRWEHLQGINKNHKYVPTYTLSGFVWAFKNLNPIYDLGLTIAARRSDWYIIFLDLFIHYIRRTPPIGATSICDDYLQKLFAARKCGKIERKDFLIVCRTESSIIEINLIHDGLITELNACIFKLEAIIQVLARERNGGVAEKLDFNDDLSHLSIDFCDELNHEFLELFESTICFSGSASLDLLFDEDVAKNLNPIYDLGPTIAARRSDWYTVFLDLFIHYIPRTPPIGATSICDDYLQKLFAARKCGKIERKDFLIVCRTESSIIEINLIHDDLITELNACIFKLEAIIQVLAREQNGGVSKKLDFNDDLSHLSNDFCDELNHEFLELFESTICFSGLASLDLRFDEDVAKEYIVQEELRLRIKEKERVQLKEQKIMEEDNRLRLEREKMLRLEENKRERIAPAKRGLVSGDASLYYWVKTYRIAEKKRPYYGLKEPDVTELIKDVIPWVEHIELWVNYMWYVRPDKADWVMVSSYFVQLLLQETLHCGMLIGRDSLFHGPMLTKMTSSDDLVLDVFNDTCFIDYPLRYTGSLFPMRLSRNERLSYSHISEFSLLLVYINSSFIDTFDDMVLTG